MAKKCLRFLKPGRPVFQFFCLQLSTLFRKKISFFDWKNTGIFLDFFLNFRQSVIKKSRFWRKIIIFGKNLTITGGHLWHWRIGACYSDFEVMQHLRHCNRCVNATLASMQHLQHCNTCVTSKWLWILKKATLQWRICCNDAFSLSESGFL